MAGPDIAAPGPAPRWKVVAAFAAVYIVWGSTYLAIRFAVETLPPFGMAGVRYLIAGTLLYAFARARGAPRPTRREWKGAGVVGVLLLLGGNGGVVYAELTLASGIAALLVSTVPIWMVVLDALRPGGVRPGRAVVAGLVAGFAGVALLVGPDAFGAAGGVDSVGAAAVLVASLSWSVGSLLSRQVALPSSPLLGTAMEMLAGGAALAAVGLAVGEAGRFDPAQVSRASLLSLLYLIVFGSLVAFTAYVWLLRAVPTAWVATYAYVNPVVAVLLGWALAGETVSGRMLLAAAVIVGAVALITTARSRPPGSQAPGSPPPPIEPPAPDVRAAEGSGRRAAATVVLLALPAALAGCGAPAPASLPEGTLLLGRREALAPLLAEVGTLAGTPLARAATIAGEKVAGCEEFEAFCALGEADCRLVDRLGCRRRDARLAAAHAARGDAGWLFAAPLGGGRLVARGDPVAGGGHRVEGELAGVDADGPVGLLLPAQEGPGPARLDGGQALVRVRVRPQAGLDLARHLSAEDAAARLFRLKADLFAAAALGEAWELAVYTPREGQIIPPVALAVEIGSRDLAVAAMERFVAEVTETWPVRRVPHAEAGWPGACLPDLAVLPELSPCYVATDRELVIGWNPPSLELALSRSAGESTAAGREGSTLGADSGEASFFTLALDRLPEADGRLARAARLAAATPVVYPWRALTVTGRREGDRFRFHATLEGR